MTALTTPPEQALYSVHRERMLLGCILVDPWASIAEIDRVGFDDADLYRDAHRLLYRLIRRMAADGTEPTEEAVLDRLMEASMGADVGGLAYVSGMSTQATGAASVAPTILQIQRLAARRRILSSVETTLALIAEGADPAEITGAAVACLSTIADPASGRSRVRTFADLADSVLRSCNDPSSRVPVWSTGMKAVDDLLRGGLSPGRLYVIGGRPKHGKSTLALNMLAGLALGGHRTHTVSLEMSVTTKGDTETAGDVAKKVIALVAGVDSLRVTDAPELMGEEKYRAVHRAAMNVYEWPGTFDDTPGRTIDQITTQARQIAAQFSDLKVLCVDHAGLVRGRPGEDRRVAMIGVTGGLKVLAKELGIAVLLVSQINRGSVVRDYPLVSDLKESGSLEEDADGILLVMNPHEAGMQTTTPALWVSLAAHRHGPSGHKWMAFEPSNGRFGAEIKDPIITATPPKPGQGRKMNDTWDEDEA